MVTIYGPGGAVTIAGQPIDVTVAGDVTVDNFPADLATNATVAGLAAKVPDEEGTWSYLAGVDGTVVVPAGGRVIGIAAVAAGPDATLSIDGGDEIPVPENFGVDVAPRGNVTAPTIEFTGTASYLVEFVT